MIVIGMQSGTSADGIDAAAASITIEDDVVRFEPLGARTTPLPPDVRDALEQVLPPGAADARAVCVLDTLLGQAFAAAAVSADETLCDGRAQLVVSHGQTVYHWVEGAVCRGTLQLGQPAWIAEATGKPVVADLRAADVACGGHGAPLASLLDRLLLAGTPGRHAALNLGGIANVSVVADGTLEAAYDTGPANALIDAAARMTLGAPYDRDGTEAARGTPHDALLSVLLADDYYALPAPKSTGREHFNRAYLQAALGDESVGLSAGTGQIPAADLLATVTELTASTVAADLRRAAVEQVVVSGGGARNPTLMAALRRHLPSARVEPIDRWGIPADAKESYLFALLGYLSAHGIPASDPVATGASRPAILGCLLPADGSLRRDEVVARSPRSLRVVQS